MPKFLIAEISNMHGGDIDKAKELILAARESGADAVKGQAFVPSDMIGKGTMPAQFYEKCSLFYDEYLELIAFGSANGIPVFFTIISDHYRRLAFWQRYQKIYAKQWDELPLSKAKEIDSPEYLVSMRALRPIPLESARIMYATEYGQPIDNDTYWQLFEYYGRPIGISHHGATLDDLLAKIKEGVELPVIEKHFFLGEKISFNGHIYRDCLHAATPKDFAALAKTYK